jgi:hypothetical protein
MLRLSTGALFVVVIAACNPGAIGPATGRDGGGPDGAGADGGSDATAAGDPGAADIGSSPDGAGSDPGPADPAPADGSGGDAVVNPDIPGGGTILFVESFDNGDFGGRGWYDGGTPTLSTTDKVAGASSFQCTFQQRSAPGTPSTCPSPARHTFVATESVYASFWLKLSTNWVGSGLPYHPHMMHFINDLDGNWVGPSHTYLTTYMEVVGGRALLALQDAKNVDLGCILRNDDTFVGCGGNFSTYVFGEDRSVCACNGLMGLVDGRDCFSNGDGTWYSARSWDYPGAFVDDAGPFYKGDWHFVEIYFEMNTIAGGIAQADGKIRWLQDGVTLIASDNILLRTGQRPTLAFKQFAVMPYIGDGSPITQSFWLDELTVATARPD